MASPSAGTTLAPLSNAPPSVSLGVPGQAPLGSDVSFSVTFNNNDPANGVGFGPVQDVILDTTGADGDDGLGTTSISAEYAGIPFSTGGANPTMWVLTFNGAGQATHPLFRDNTGAFINVTGTSGDELVVLRLPFGSFSYEQPPAVVTLNVNLSNLADLGTPLGITARGGYEFGYTPLDDWCCGDPASASPQRLVGRQPYAHAGDVGQSLRRPGRRLRRNGDGPNFPGNTK